MAVAMTFLELVNRAVSESKASLDPLTSANFASPPRTDMYNHFKDWINDAYEELFTDHNDWFFRRERATVSVWPRVLVGGMTYLPSVGDVLTTASSGTIMTVRGVHLFEEADNNAATEYTLSVEFDSSSDPRNLILKETINRTSPTSATNVGFIAGQGYYDFSELVPFLDDIDRDSVSLYRLPSSTVYNTGQFANIVTKIDYIERTTWPNEYNLYPWSGPYPRFMSQMASGAYALYPQPEAEMMVSFEYFRQVARLSAYDDKPLIPAEYHMYLVWKAVEEYADFDRNGALFKRAQKHLNKFEANMLNNELPKIKIQAWNGVYRG